MGMFVAETVGTVLGCIIGLACVISVISLILTAICSVINIIVAPLEYLAKIVQEVQTANVTKQEIERENISGFDEYNLALKPYQHIPRPYIPNEKHPPGFGKI